MVVFNPLLGGLLSLTVWIYLVWVVRKQKAQIFEGHLDQSQAEELLKRLKAILLFAGVSFLVFVVTTIVNGARRGVSDGEETVFFFVSLVVLGVFILSTFGGLYIFVRGRRQNV